MEPMPRIEHKSLSIFVHFVPNLLSVRDPVSLVRKLTSFRLSILDESKAVYSLHWLPQKRPLRGLFMEPMPRIELGTYALPWRCSTI